MRNVGTIGLKTMVLVCNTVSSTKGISRVESRDRTSINMENKRDVTWTELASIIENSPSTIIQS